MIRIVLMVAACATAGCAAMGPRTEFDSTWQDPTYADGGFDRIAVLANFRTESDSRNFEDAVALELERRGVMAIKGRSFLDNGGRYTEDELEAQLRDVAADGVLLFKLIAVDEDLKYVRPQEYLDGVPRRFIYGDPNFWYYHPHWTYYPYWRSSFDVARSSAYWRRYRYVVVETSLYDNATDQLVWTAKSETMEPSDYSRLGTSIAGAVTTRLASLDLLDLQRSPAAVARAAR